MKEKGEETKVILTKYWEELIEDNEKLRYSVQCKEAFQFLRRVFKYNQFERRDGSIVDRMLHDDKLVMEEAVVNRLVMDNLKNLQVDAKYSNYTGYIPFPKLDPLGVDEIECVPA